MIDWQAFDQSLERAGEHLEDASTHISSAESRHASIAHPANVDPTPALQTADHERTVRGLVTWICKHHLELSGRAMSAAEGDLRVARGVLEGGAEGAERGEEREGDKEREEREEKEERQEKVRCLETRMEGLKTRWKELRTVFPSNSGVGTSASASLASPQNADDHHRPADEEVEGTSLKAPQADAVCALDGFRRNFGKAAEEEVQRLLEQVGRNRGVTGAVMQQCLLMVRVLRRSIRPCMFCPSGIKSLIRRLHAAGWCRTPSPSTSNTPSQKQTQN